MTLEAYSNFRKRHHSQIIQARQNRSLNLGQHMRLQFESELTLRYQIQEMLRIERIFEAPLIQSEIDTYAPLMPQGQDWSITMFLQFPDVLERREALTRLWGVQRRVFVQIQGQGRVYAREQEASGQACTSMPTPTPIPTPVSVAATNPNVPQKTSAVHFLRFQFSKDMVELIKASTPVRLGCDHEHYSDVCDLSQELLGELVRDFA